jgi:hypothetical protein
MTAGCARNAGAALTFPSKLKPDPPPALSRYFVGAGSGAGAALSSQSAHRLPGRNANEKLAGPVASGLKHAVESSGLRRRRDRSSPIGFVRFSPPKPGSTNFRVDGSKTDVLSDERRQRRAELRQIPEAA